jgi:glutamyl-tRNA reductase
MECRDLHLEATHRQMADTGPLVGQAPAAFVAETRLQATDTVVAKFRDALSRIQGTELDRLYDRLPDLDEQSRNAIRQFADLLVAEVFYPPLRSLRDESRDGESRHLRDALARLYGLSD